MQQSFPNVLPVANRVLGRKEFLRAQAEHEKNIKHARGTIDHSAPIARPHCTQRLRQKQIREHELAMIEQDNERLRQRMQKNGSKVDTHNTYVLNSLHADKREREQALHEREFQRLQRLISQARTNYSNEEYKQDFNRAQDIKRRMSRFSAN